MIFILESALALKFVCYPNCLCVVQVIIKQHDIMVTSTDLALGLVFPCLYELYRDVVENVRMTVLQQDFTITESLYNVFVGELPAVAE